MPTDDPTTAPAAAIERYDRAAPAPTDTETATFALGCFWGPDAQFGGLDGVVRTRVGYAGGTEPDPTYHAIGDHSEAVQVDYEPDRLSYADLLDLAFRSHDPDHQPRKRQYHSAIFYDGDEQAATVEQFLDGRGLDPDRIATRIEPLERFTLAEDYHQKYELRADPWLSGHFEDAGYGPADLRESPAAARVNAHAAGGALPAALSVLASEHHAER